MLQWLCTHHKRPCCKMKSYLKNQSKLYCYYPPSLAGYTCLLGISFSYPIPISPLFSHQPPLYFVFPTCSLHMPSISLSASNCFQFHFTFSGVLMPVSNTSIHLLPSIVSPYTFPKPVLLSCLWMYGDSSLCTS